MAAVTADAETRKALGARIRARRLALGWTMEKLAGEADVSMSGLRKTEHGYTYPARVTLRCLANALGTTPEELKRPDHS